MSDGVRIELASVPDIEDIARRVQSAVEQRMKLHAEDMRRHAENPIPIRTGRLKENLYTKVTTSSKAVTITIGDNARSKPKKGSGEMYGVFVEFGTGQKGMEGGNTYDGHTDLSISYNASWPGMKARPFIRPAVYDLYPKLVEDLNRDIGEAMK